MPEPAYVTDSEDEDGNTRAHRPSRKQHIRIIAHTLDRIYVLVYQTHWTMAQLREELLQNPRTAGNVVPRDGQFAFRYGQGPRVKLVALEDEPDLLARDLNRRQLTIHLYNPASMEDPESRSRPHLV